VTESNVIFIVSFVCEFHLDYTAFVRQCRIYGMVIIDTDFLFASLERMGALDWNKIVHQHQGWRLISCIWLHAGLIHLIVNMLSLLFVGIRLEQQFGFGKILSVLNHCNCDLIST
jgi:membrane associated rhomboid family serine protease